MKGLPPRPPGRRRAGARRQRGAVLVISLVILLLLTLVGVTGMQSTTLEERMAGNSRQRDVAFQAAETAFRDAEWLIEHKTDGTSLADPYAASVFDPTCSGGLCASADVAATLSSELWRTVDWTGPQARRVGQNLAALAPVDAARAEAELPEAVAGVPEQPRYVIEATRLQFAGNPDARWVYRMTARGYGADVGPGAAAAPRTQVVLQQIYTPFD